MSGLDSFFKILEAYRKTLTWALGGSAILPLIASFAGLAPLYPLGVSILTSLFTLLAVVFCFQFFRYRSKKFTNKIMTISIVTMIVTLAIYLAVFSIFTFELPTTHELIYLGCGWGDTTKELLPSYLLAADQDCPGQQVLYEKILEDTRYESGIVWTTGSVTIIKLVVLALWLGVFSSLATFLGTFLVYQAAQKT